MVTPEATGQAQPRVVDSLPPRRGRWIPLALGVAGIAALLLIAVASGSQVQSFPEGYKPRDGETVIDSNPPVS